LSGGLNGGVLIDDEVFDPSTRREGNLVEHSLVEVGYDEPMGIRLPARRTLDRFDLERAVVAAGLDVSPVELPLVIKGEP
jgi:hypothetical protein